MRGTRNPWNKSSPLSGSADGDAVAEGGWLIGRAVPVVAVVPGAVVPAEATVLVETVVPVEAVFPGIDSVVPAVAIVAVAMDEAVGSVNEPDADVAVGEAVGATVPKPTPGGMESDRGASVNDGVV